LRGWLSTIDLMVIIMATAKFEVKKSWLGTEFGESYARKLFGNDVVDTMPKYSKGKNIGKFKVELRWVKCTAGGWVKTGNRHETQSFAEGFVENKSGSTVYAVLIDAFNGEIFATDREYNYHYERMVK
jgi:hypothetical protein